MNPGKSHGFLTRREEYRLSDMNRPLDPAAVWFYPFWHLRSKSWVGSCLSSKNMAISTEKNIRKLGIQYSISIIYIYIGDIGDITCFFIRSISEIWLCDLGWRLQSNNKTCQSMFAILECLQNGGGFRKLRRTNRTGIDLIRPPRPVASSFAIPAALYA